MTKSSVRRYAWLVAALVLAAALVVVLWWRQIDLAPTDVVEYAMLEARDTPAVLAIAPDDTVWFTIDFAAAVGRIRDGKLERIPKARVSLEPIGLAVKADGSAWMTDSEARQILRVAPDGELSAVDIETPVARLGKIAAASDGSLWFAEATAYSITRLRDGELKRHVIDSVRGGPLGVAVAPDGAVWATLQSGNQLLRIAPDGTMRSHDIPTRSSSPADIAVGSDGAVWFLEFRGNKVGRFAEDRFEEFPAGEMSAGLTGLAVAPDGAVWFGMLRKGSLGRLRGGAIKEFKLPREGARPYSVAVDAQGNIWYTDISGYVGMLKAAAARK